MAIQCTIRPRVRNNNGNVVESNLHNDLVDFTIGDLELANKLWGLSRTEEFNDENHELPKDVNGEHRIEYFLSSPTTQQFITDSQLEKGLEQLYREDTKETSVSGIHSVSRAANSFNENSPLNSKLEARVENDNGNTKVVFNVKDEESSRRIENISKGEKLSDFLRKWWSDRGFAIDALDEAEEGSGINAVTDFSATRRLASGIPVLIRVARNEIGEQAIPEETAHAVIAGLHGKDVAVDRTINAFINNESLVREVMGDMYDTYLERYKGDKTKMAHEAVGQLLADQIKNEYEKQKLKTHRTLLQRLKNAVLDFFRQFRENEIEEAYRDSLSTLRNVAKKIVEGQEYMQLDFDAYANDFGELYQLTKKGKEKVDEYLDKLIKSTEANITILSHSKGTSGRISHKETTLTLMNKCKYAGNSLEGILAYMNSMNGDLEYQMNSFKTKLAKKDSDNWTEKARIIYNVINITNEYRAVIDDFSLCIEEINEIAQNDSKLNDIVNDINNVIDSTEKKLRQINASAHNEALPVFIEYSKLFCKDNVVVPFGEAYGYKEGETVSLEETMMSSKEPTLFEMFLSASQSSSFNIQSLGRIITILKENVRKEVIEYTDQLKQLTYDLEKEGYDNQEWMFERKNGVLTGNYLRTDSQEYKKLSDVQKKYYQKVIEIKEELDEKIPEGLRKTLNAPKVRKDFIEILRNSDDKVADAWDKIKDFGIVRSDDEYILSDETLATTYDGRSFRSVPLRFLAFSENEKKDNMSTDIVESLSIYAQMACNYAVMHEAMPVLELAKMNIEEGDIVENIKTKSLDNDGNEVINEERKFIKKRNEGGGSRELSRINSLYEDQLYGIKVKDIGNIPGTQINATAVAHKLMAWTALNQYALNPLGAVENEITGLLMSRIEALGGEFFNNSDLAFAHATFTSNLPTILGEYGERIQTSKFNLFYKKFNVMQEDETRDQNFNRKTKLGRTLNGKSFYWMTDMGEFNLHGISSIAIANHMKLKDKDGNPISLWEALEVVDMYEDAQRTKLALLRRGKIEEAKELGEKINNHPEWKGSEVKKLVVKEGVTNPDGTEITEKDLTKITRKMMQVNHRLHGIYNNEDRSQVQQHIVGQMCMMYRKWIFPALCRRFENLNYNQDLEQWTEGYYQTFARRYYGQIKRMFGDTHVAIKSWDELSDLEKSNIKRAYTEIGIWAAMLTLAMIMRRIKKKDRKHSFFFSCLYYWTTRTLSEMNAYVPWGVPTETFRILKSPSATLSIMNNIAGLAGCMNPLNYEYFGGDNAIIKSGKYKDHSKAWRAFFNSPIIPFSHQWNANSDPIESAKFYELN